MTPAATSRAASDWTMNKARETVARSAVRAARERPMRASASRDARARRLVFTRDVDRKLNLIMMCVRIKFLSSVRAENGVYASVEYALWSRLPNPIQLYEL